MVIKLLILSNTHTGEERIDENVTSLKTLYIVKCNLVY